MGVRQIRCGTWCLARLPSQQRASIVRSIINSQDCLKSPWFYGVDPVNLGTSYAYNEAGRFDCSAPKPAPPSDHIPLCGVGHDAPFNLDGLMSNDGTFIDCIVSPSWYSARKEWGRGSQTGIRREAKTPPFTSNRQRPRLPEGRRLHLLSLNTGSRFACPSRFLRVDRRVPS